MLLDAELRLVDAARQGPGEARDRLVESFTPLIARMARRYCISRGIEQKELMQEGVAGLLRALERYDRDTGTPFWAYASWWVRHAMQRLVSEMVGPVVLSDRALRQLARINHARRTHAIRHGCQASTSALAAGTGLGADQIKNLTAATRKPRGLSEPLGESDGTTLGDQLADAHAEDAYDRVLQRVAAETVPQLLKTLDDRERTLVEGRFGFAGPEQTLSELGGALGVSTERARQIEARALGKLRALAEATPARA
jgi:RNA polymerase primary sigma factor